jgi:hypothetical protein
MKIRLHKTLSGLIVKIATPVVALTVSLTTPVLSQTSLANASAAIANGPTTQSALSAAQPVSCLNFVAIPVALETGQTCQLCVSGELCATATELRSGTTVQLLIHNATYTP